MDLIENDNFHKKYEINDNNDDEELQIYRRQPRRIRARPVYLNNWNDMTFKFNLGQVHM